jgi:hypothetical protein
MIRTRKSLYVILAALVLVVGTAAGVWAYTTRDEGGEGKEEHGMFVYLEEIPPVEVADTPTFRLITREHVPPPPPPPPPRFILTTQDGFLAVFHADTKGPVRLMEQTSIPVAPLPQAERDRLTLGILVYTEEALHRLLEDYGS